MHNSNRRLAILQTFAGAMILAGCKPDQTTAKGAGHSQNTVAFNPNNLPGTPGGVPLGHLPENLRSNKSRTSNQVNASKATGDEITQGFEIVSANMHGFVTGKQDSQSVFYVLVDPMCPYCALSWKQAKALWPHYQFVWLPAPLLGPKSRLLGAAILGSENPGISMNLHEAFINKEGPEISYSPEMLAKGESLIEHNSQAAIAMRVDSVPLIFFKKTSGEIVSTDGAISATEFVAIATAR